MYNWKDHESGSYFFNETSGKVTGAIFKIANQNVLYTAKVYTGDTTFMLEDEKHLGQYIGMEYAKKAIERFWNVFDKTLLEE